MSEKIKRLKRELKYKGAIVDFYQDTMEIDGTHTATWDFISHKGAAAVVPVTEDGKILMVRQYRIEVFVARDLIPSRQHLDEDEFIDLKAYTLEELKEKIFSGEIEDSKTIAALLAYETKYRKTE